MIRDFADKATEHLYDGLNSKESRKFPREIIKRTLQLLDIMNHSVDLNALKTPPSNRLELLKGDRKGEYSVRINDQWRIVFKFQNGDFYSVKVEDYHK
jgi:proteic killer suppression protein